MRFALFASLLFCSACTLVADNTHPPAARLIPLAQDAFSGSSVNVLSGVKQTLYTRNGMQYAAFYNAKAKLVVAKRAVQDVKWQLLETSFSGNVNDAHNHISLVVEDEDYVHIAWDHHNTPLKYARSVAPGSLQLAKARMLSQPGAETAALENSVTYPQFYALANGDLLFAYRDGGSGRGNLVLNRYNGESQQWQRLHNSLIDGEGQRSAYWDMAVDANGVLHLVWIWRETPDVATNHDLSYAQSTDHGATWQRLNGQPYSLPITQGTGEVVKAVPQQHKLMNPPVVTADAQSWPFIASYWADTPTDIPRYHVVFSNSAEGKESPEWHELKAPKVADNFALSGHGTKRPPISRAVLLVDSASNTRKVHLIYRDDYQHGKVIALSSALEQPNWHSQVLLDKAVGAWEPSLDIAAWHNQRQAHLLLQAVAQNDGNDQQSLATVPSHIGVLVWQPHKKE